MTAARTINPPSPLLFAAETGRVFGSIYSYFLSYPFLQFAPKGDGQPVLVLPGFLTGDASTLLLRKFLDRRGYDTYGWDMGINWGRGIDPINVVPSDAKTLALVRRLHETTGRKVSIIGWSLGGIYAREIARIMPDAVRQVITLVSPFRGQPRASNIWRLFERYSGHDVDEITENVRERITTPPPVPTTAIYSRTDGITAWETCIEDLDKCIECENIELETSHLGVGFSPLALWAIADRLAQAEGEWQPFDTSGVKSLLYRNWLRL